MNRFSPSALRLAASLAIITVLALLGTVDGHAVETPTGTPVPLVSVPLLDEDEPRITAEDLSPDGHGWSRSFAVAACDEGAVAPEANPPCSAAAWTDLLAVIWVMCGSGSFIIHEFHCIMLLDGREHYQARFECD